MSTVEEPHLFDPGPPIVRPIDPDSMPTQLRLVYEAMKDSEWRTLADATELANSYAKAMGTERCTEPSVSARLRDLRKLGHTVERRRDRASGLNEYRFTP